MIKTKQYPENICKINALCIDKAIITIYIIAIVYLINTIKRIYTISKDFFLHPTDPMQKRYEAVRASFVDELSAKEVAHRFGCSVHTINALRRDFISGSLPPFFLPLIKGPKQPRPTTLECKGRIIELRKKTTPSMRSKKSSYAKVLLLLPKQYTRSFKQKALQNSFAEHMPKDELVYKGLRSQQR